MKCGPLSLKKTLSHFLPLGSKEDGKEPPPPYARLAEGLIPARPGLLPRAVLFAGKGMARIGGPGAAAFGVGRGLGFYLLFGMAGLLVPLVGAVAYGVRAAIAKAAHKRLSSGTSENVRRDALAIASAGATGLLIPTLAGESGLAFVLAGLPALLGAIPVMLGSAYVIGRAATDAADYLISQAAVGQKSTKQQ